MLAVLAAAALVVAMINLREAPPPPPPPPPVAAQVRPAEESVVVLPGPDGRVGAVVVQRGEARQLLDQPFAASRIVGGGAPEAIRRSEADVRREFASTLAALPARPASFTVYFVTGRDELTVDSRADLDRILAELRTRPVPDVIVIGHTDTVGSTDANDRLALQRAERVKGFLVGIGIPAERIQIAGRGERELLVPTADNVAEPRNRRVEISVR